MLKKNVTIISTLCGLRCPTRASRHPRPLRRTGTLPPHPGPGACAPHTRYVRRPGHTAHALDGIYGKTAPPPPKIYIGAGGGGGGCFPLKRKNKFKRSAQNGQTPWSHKVIQSIKSPTSSGSLCSNVGGLHLQLARHVARSSAGGDDQPSGPSSSSRRSTTP